MEKQERIWLGGAALCALLSWGRFFFLQSGVDHSAHSKGARSQQASASRFAPGANEGAFAASAPFASAHTAASPVGTDARHIDRQGSKGAAQRDALPIVGAAQTITLPHAETLLHLARQYNTDPLTLSRLNPLAAPHPNAPEVQRVKAGTRLKLPSREILPLYPSDGMVLNIPERGLYVFEDGQLVARYPTAVGQATWQTPTGEFRVVRLVKDPVWLPPREMVRREGTKPEKVPPGPDNPLGDRWIGWSAPQVGFHSTWLEASVGQAASHGCVRMYPESAHQLFDLVDVGTPIHSVYMPVKVGRDGRNIYLSVSPDIYHRGLATLARAQQRLHKAGLNHADAALLKRIVREQDGAPHFVGALATPPAPFPLSRNTASAPVPPFSAADSLLRPTDMPHAAQADAGKPDGAGGQNANPKGAGIDIP